MPDYASMYRKVFNSATDAIAILQKAQQEAEEIFISPPEPDIKVLEPGKTKEKPPEKE